MALVVVAMLVLVLPWSVRNFVRMNAPVLISTNLGDNLCIGNNPQATGGYDLARPCFQGLHGGDRPESETERQSTTFRRAWDYVREEPVEAILRLPAKVRYALDRDSDGLWGSTDYGGHELFSSPTTFERVKVVGDVYYAVVGVLGAVGAVLLWRSGQPTGRRRFLLLVSVVQLVPVLVTFGDPRFKMPLYPAMAVCAGVAVLAALQRRTPEEELPAV
jgi:hypothetical protein